MKKHDENKDVHILSKFVKIDSRNKTIRASKDTCIGIRLWGRIDFLTKYRGYFFWWDNTVKKGAIVPMSDDVKIKEKKEQHKLSDKR